MCTLILAWRAFDDAPLIAAANRDEASGRPSSPPAIDAGEPAVLAPTDEQAGGTWIGVGAGGQFVAITNRDADLAGERSRGLLVQDALGATDASAAARLIEREVTERSYAGFDLLVADAERARLSTWDGSFRQVGLDAGIHVVVNGGHDDGHPKSRRIRAAVSDPAPNPGDPDRWLERVRATLRDHDLGACVHGDRGGTRSSSLVTIGGSGRVSWWHADGPPCETPYHEVDFGPSADSGGADGQV